MLLHFQRPWPSVVKNTSLVLDGLNVIEVTLSISEAVSLVQEVPLLVVLYKPPGHWVLPSR